MENPIRKQVRYHHRYASDKLKSDPGNTRFVTTPPLHTQIAPKKLSGLKEIYLESMDFSADKVYEGYCLTGTIIEPIYKMNGIHSIIEDEKGKVVKITLYNMGNLESQVIVGQVIVIMNPYMRQAASRETLIRIDDPKSVIFSDLKEICWSCTQSKEEVAKLSNCAKCKAKYCSRECQIFDWNNGHKLICGLK